MTWTLPKWVCWHSIRSSQHLSSAFSKEHLVSPHTISSFLSTLCDELLSNDLSKCSWRSFLRLKFQRNQRYSLDSCVSQLKSIWACLLVSSVSLSLSLPTLFFNDNDHRPIHILVITGKPNRGGSQGYCKILEGTESKGIELQLTTIRRSIIRIPTSHSLSLLCSEIAVSRIDDASISFPKSNNELSKEWILCSERIHCLT